MAQTGDRNRDPKSPKFGAGPVQKSKKFPVGHPDANLTFIRYAGVPIPTYGAARRGAARRQRHTVIFSLIVTVLVLYHIMIIAIIDY